MPKKNYSFNLKLHTFGVNYLVAVSGFNVYSDYYSEGQVTTRYPVNHLMHSSETTFVVATFPGDSGYNPNGFLSISLEVVDGEKEFEVPLIEISAGGIAEDPMQAVSGSLKKGKYRLAEPLALDDEGDVELLPVESRAFSEAGPLSFAFQRVLKFPTGFPEWAFFNSEILPDYYAMNDEDYEKHKLELYKIYREIWQDISDNEFGSFDKIFAERSAELEKAFYRDSGTETEELLKSIKENLTDPEKRLADMPKEAVDIILHYGRNFVELKRTETQNAIAFSGVQGGTTSFPIVFRKENDKWIVAR